MQKGYIFLEKCTHFYGFCLKYMFEIKNSGVHAKKKMTIVRKADLYLGEVLVENGM